MLYKHRSQESQLWAVAGSAGPAAQAYSADPKQGRRERCWEGSAPPMKVNVALCGRTCLQFDTQLQLTKWRPDSGFHILTLSRRGPQMKRFSSLFQLGHLRVALCAHALVHLHEQKVFHLASKSGAAWAEPAHVGLGHKLPRHNCTKHIKSFH